MSDEDYILDIAGMGDRGDKGRDDEGGDKSQREEGKAWISVYFECCRVYQRIYRNREGTAYVGWCPKCSRKVTALIGPGGTDQRFFTAH